MNKKTKHLILLILFAFTNPVSLYAQHTISHGGKRPQTNQHKPPKKPVRSKASIIKELCNNMIYIVGGTFQMGATSEQGTPNDNTNMPVHEVTVSSFSIGKYEVTQEEWQSIMGDNPSECKGSKRPVENVSWNDCQRFIKKLNQATGRSFRLPTEAEWEYAARGGKNEFKFSGSNTFSEVGWCKANSGEDTHIVGQKGANEFGLYDMSGNVGEWCQDWWGAYPSDAQSNPKGPSTGEYRITRGGSVNASKQGCRTSERYGDKPDASFWNIGFRLAE